VIKPPTVRDPLRDAVPGLADAQARPHADVSVHHLLGPAEATLSAAAYLGARLARADLPEAVRSRDGD